MTHATRSTNKALTANADLIRLESGINGRTETAYTVGMALGMASLDFICAPSGSNVLVYQEIGRHFYTVANDGTVTDLTGSRHVQLSASSKRAIAVRFYVDCVMSAQKTQVRVKDWSLVRRAFGQVTASPTRHL